VSGRRSAIKALLLNPGIFDFAAYDLWARPLGLLRVGAQLRRWGWETVLVDFLDRFHPELGAFSASRYARFDAYGCGKYPREEIPPPPVLAGFGRRYFRYGFPPALARETLAAAGRPRLILIGSGMTYWYPAVREAVALARDVFPGVPVVLGGIYARLLPAHAAAVCRPDLVQAGRGPASLARSLGRLGFPVAPVPGTPPPPDYGLLRDRTAIPLQLSRGCPFRCSYCAGPLLEPDIAGEDPVRAADTVARERDQGTTDFAFYDNALLHCAGTALRPFLREVLRRGGGCRFHTPNGLHARLLDPETAELMRAAGFATVRIGLETVDPGRQMATGGKVANADLERAARLLQAAGFEPGRIGVYTLLGYPGQTPAEVEADIGFVHSLGLRTILAAFSPIPGTRTFGELQAAGAAPEEPLLQNNTVFPSLGGVFTAAEVRRLRELAASANRRLPGAAGRDLRPSPAEKRSERAPTEPGREEPRTEWSPGLSDYG